MKATNSLDGFGIRMVSVVSILVCFIDPLILQRYNNKFNTANFKGYNFRTICNINVLRHRDVFTAYTGEYIKIRGCGHPAASL